MAVKKGIVAPGKYAFDASAKKITFHSDYTGIALSDIMYIINATKTTVIYNPELTAKGGALTGLELILTYNTASMDDNDSLMIIVGMSALEAAALESILSDILAKIIPAPATEAKQDDLITGQTAQLANEFEIITKLTSIFGKLITAPATEAKQDALNAKDFATQTTLAAVLAKLITAPSTEAKQDDIITALTAIFSKLIYTPATEEKQDILIAKDFATQTTLAALLAKVIAAPATEAKQDSILAKLIAAPATEAKQDLLQAVLDAIKDTAGIKKIVDPLPAGSNLLGKTGIDQATDGITNKVRATATKKQSFGAHTALTVTNLNSLVSSATNGWQSDRIDNTSVRATDYMILAELTMPNSAPGSDKAVYLFVAPWYYDGSVWHPASQGTATALTGTQGTTTIAEPNNLLLIGALNFTTANSVISGVFFLKNVFGDNIPDGFSLVAKNFSGATISASGNVIAYKAINEILA